MEKTILNINTFIDLWLEKETTKMSEEDKEQYTDELADALNFTNIFKVISLWSVIPYKERIKNFLETNNFTLEEEILKELE